MPVSAVSPGELAAGIKESTVFLGEGAHVYREFLADRLGGLARFAPRAMSYPSGASVAFMGQREIAGGRASDAFTLVPSYIRKSDAEEKQFA